MLSKKIQTWCRKNNKKLLFFIVVIAIVGVSLFFHYKQFILNLTDFPREESLPSDKAALYLKERTDLITGFVIAHDTESGFKITINDIKFPSIETTFYGVKSLELLGEEDKYSVEDIEKLLEESYSGKGYYQTKDMENPLKETFFALYLLNKFNIPIEDKNDDIVSWLNQNLRQDLSEEELYYNYCSLAELGEKPDFIHEKLNNLKVEQKYLTSTYQDYYLVGDTSNERLNYVRKALECLGKEVPDKELLCRKYRTVNLELGNTHLDALHTRIELIRGFCGLPLHPVRFLGLLRKFYSEEKNGFYMIKAIDPSIKATYLGVDILKRQNCVGITDSIKTDECLQELAKTAMEDLEEAIQVCSYIKSELLLDKCLLDLKTEENKEKVCANIKSEVWRTVCLTE